MNNCKEYQLNDVDTFLNTREGWDIHFCEGSADGDWQIQAIDDFKLFKDDMEAIAFVFAQAYRGSIRHLNAIKYIRDNNPLEYTKIDKIAFKFFGASVTELFQN